MPLPADTAGDDQLDGGVVTDVVGQRYLNATLGNVSINNFTV